jgi:hypothetical protein
MQRRTRRERASGDAQYAAAWVLVGADNQSLPFAVVDKRDARIYVFEAGGRLLGASAVLLGAAPGDFAVGDMTGRAPASLTPAERTTPAGRFASEPGRNDRCCLAQTAVAVRRGSMTISDPPSRLRPRRNGGRRLASPSPDDNRIPRAASSCPSPSTSPSSRRRWAARPRRRLRAARVAPGDEPAGALEPRLLVD